MSDLEEVPIVEVHSGNFKEIWPSLVLAIQSSTFVAIDLELSGLGDRKQLFAKTIDDRYKAICDVARTRSIIALGLSCYKLANQSVDDNEPVQPVTAFQVQTFNIFVLCAEKYVVEPLSVKFLVNHGFDFNRQYSQGVPYTRGVDKPDNAVHQSLRQLFTELILSNVPIVLHNAMVDLVFLYESLYTSLPSALPTFLTDLSQIFSAGVYDTKYIAEFKARMQASFLEYAFRKSQRDSSVHMGRGLAHVDIVFLHYPVCMQQHIAILSCGLASLPSQRESGKICICKNFASHGWCTAGFNCPNSHDVDLILDSEDWVITRKKQKRGKKNKQKASEPGATNGQHAICNDETAMDTTTHDHSDIDDIDDSSPATSVGKMQLEENSSVDRVITETSEMEAKAPGVVRTGGHRAGFDAFMTGYIFAWCLARYGRVPPVDSSTKLTVRDLIVGDEFLNKVYLGGKDFPLQVSQGNFAKPSKAHLEKWERLKAATS